MIVSVTSSEVYLADIVTTTYSPSHSGIGKLILKVLFVVVEKQLSRPFHTLIVNARTRSC